jgi:hypothetical protein
MMVIYHRIDDGLAIIVAPSYPTASVEPAEIMGNRRISS